MSPDYSTIAVALQLSAGDANMNVGNKLLWLAVRTPDL
jgi:hypothetical protein